MATANIRFTAEDRRHQILEAATELFAAQGYQGTTTRQIALKADVNEAIIFRHFPSKDELYWEVIDHKCHKDRGHARLRARLTDPAATHQEKFAAIAADFIRWHENDPSLNRLLLFSALENHKLSHRFFRTHIAELYEALGEYIRQEIALGRFRRIDPLVAARGFLGMVGNHILIQELFGGKKYHTLDAEDVSRTLADLWLNGMLPRGDDPAEASARSNGSHLEKPSK